MNTTIEDARSIENTRVASSSGTAQVNSLIRFSARVVPSSWPVTEISVQDVLQTLTRRLARQASTKRDTCGPGLRLALAWLGEQPGVTWQQRWLASGAEAAGSTWKALPAAWLHEGDQFFPTRLKALSEALPVLVSGDVIRPSFGWLLAGDGGKKSLVRHLTSLRDPEGFTRLRALCDSDRVISDVARSQVLYQCALIVAAKGGTIQQITVGDVLELFGAQKETRLSVACGRTLFYRMLHQMGGFDASAPTSLRQARTPGQRSPDELIDRYQLKCRPIRDLLVDYLRERQPALDYTSMNALSYFLGKRFWADIEAHQPGIDTLRLPRDVVDGWKKRLRTRTRTTTAADGQRTRVEVSRISYRECLTPVRALYLDLAHWAVEEPSRWAQWVAPSPVSDEEINRRKYLHQRKSRMDARTRERLPVLPVVLRNVQERRTTTHALLEAARTVAPGETFISAGTPFRRPVTSPRVDSTRIWAEDANGKRRDLSREEDNAFWAWAIVEVLHATGIRAEELHELSHHSLVQYRLPGTGELVTLLQIMPSKTDTERLLVISPDLADVFAAIIRRVSGPTGLVPLVSGYDNDERVWCSPAPRLLQRRIGTELHAIPTVGIRHLLADALTHTGLLDPITGEPLHFTPHDFRRMFITDAILNGLPPHIAQVIAGHRDINVTLGYKAVYPEETITAHLAFLARRRALRPTDEYRVPTDDEWENFLGHFERRKVSIGTCARAFSTPCIHEHACVRCPMLWPDPQQRPRLIQIRDNLIARISEAEHEGWHGEIEGLQISLTGAQDKLAQVDRRPTTTVVNLGIPTTIPSPSAPSSGIAIRAPQRSAP